MYIEALDLFCVQIPKTGSTSFKHALETAHGKVSLPGHLTVHQAYEALGRKCDCVAVVREPIARLVSGLNHIEADDLNWAMPHATRQGAQRIFIPQSHYVDDATRLVPFSKLTDLIVELGGEPVHKGASKKRWKRSDVEAHPHFQRAREYYADDFRLYRKALASWKSHEAETSGISTTAAS